MKDLELKELNKNLAFPLPKNLFSQLRNEKLKKMKSRNSEDALTWSLFRTLFHISDKEENKHPLFIPAVFPKGSSLKINFKDNNFYVWNQLTNGKEDILVQRLNCVFGCCEANPKSSSEIDGIIWDGRKGKSELFFFENKFKANFGKCSAIDKEKKCRLYRTNKKPRDNGCSYWGEGKGGDAFKRRFPKNLVSEYFKITFSRPKNLRDADTDCYRFYQLMRNVIIGKELANDMNANFTLVSIISKKHKYEESKKIWREFTKKIKHSSTMLLTWEDILKAVEQNNRIRMKKFAKWLKERLEKNFQNIITRDNRNVNSDLFHIR